MKRLVRVLAVLLLLGAAALTGLVLLRDRLLISAVERGGTAATGVATTVDSVSTGLLSGSVALEGLAVANPPGFSAEPLVRLGRVALGVPLARLSEDPLRVEEVELSGLALRIERRGEALNYQPVQERLASFGGEGDAAPAPPTAEPEAGPAAEAPEAGPARTVILERVRIADWSLHLDVGRPLIGPQDLSMGELVLTDVQVTGEGAVEKAVGEVLDALIEQALGAGAADRLPAELGPILDALRTGLADGLQGEDLERVLDTALAEVEAQARAAADELEGEARARAGEELDQALDQLKQQAGDQAAPLIDEAVKGLGGLLGGKQKSDGR